MIFGLCFAVGAFVIDQLSKWYVSSIFATTTTDKAFGKYFNLVEAWNEGVSFSMLDDYGTVGVVFLTAFALCVVLFLLHWLKNEPSRLVQASLGLVIGGAFGNIADRIRFGAVYDFLDFHYGDMHWPAFNAADTFICIGAFLIIISSLFNRRKQSLKDAVK